MSFWQKNRISIFRYLGAAIAAFILLLILEQSPCGVRGDVFWARFAFIFVFIFGAFHFGTQSKKLPGDKERKSGYW